MKKVALVFFLILGALFTVSGQEGPVDIVLLLDTSSSMSASYRELNDYMTGKFLRDFLRTGDTFHLIPFSGRPRLDISRRVEGRGDVETIIGRMLLQYPLEPWSDIAAALSFAENYVAALPARPKKIVLLSDGDPSPQPGSSSPALDAAGLESLIRSAKDRFGRQSISFDYVKVSPGAPAPLANLPASGRPALRPVPEAAPAGTGRPPAPQTVQPVTPPPVPPPDSTPRQPPQATRPTQPIAPPPVPPPDSTPRQPPRTTQPAQPIAPPPVPPPDQGFQPGRGPETGALPGAPGERPEAVSPFPDSSSRGTSVPGTPGAEFPGASVPDAGAALPGEDGQAYQDFPSPGETGTEAEIPSGETPEDSELPPSPVPPRPPAPRYTGESFSPPLVIGLVILGLAVLGLIIFLVTRRLQESPNRAISQAASRQAPEDSAASAGQFTDHSAALASYAANQRPRTGPYAHHYKPQTIDTYEGPLLLNLFVEDQNTFIGKRNIHALKPGHIFTLGGGSSDFLIFLVPIPPHIGEIRCEGNQCTFIPRKPRYFPDLGSQQVPDCIGKTVRVISDKNYELHFRLERYEDPLKALNRLLHSVQVPG
jgi:hypothetical protein